MAVLRQKDRMSLYRKLSRVFHEKSSLRLDAQKGISMLLSNERPKTDTAKALESILDRLSLGFSVAESMEKSFPRHHCHIVAAGAARLSDAFKGCCDMDESFSRIDQAIRKGLRSFSSRILSSVGMLVFFAFYVSPNLELIVKLEDWEGIASYLAAFIQFVRSPYAIVFLFLLAGMFFAGWRSLGGYTGVARPFMDKIPPWSVYKMRHGMYMLFTVSAFVRAGLDNNRAVQILQDGAPKWYRRKLERMSELMEAGYGFGEALHDCDPSMPTPPIASEVRSYSVLQGFEESMPELVDGWLKDAEEHFDQMAVRLNFVGLLVNSFTVLLIVLSTYAIPRSMNLSTAVAVLSTFFVGQAIRVASASWGGPSGLGGAEGVA